MAEPTAVSASKCPGVCKEPRSSVVRALIRTTDRPAAFHSSMTARTWLFSSAPPVPLAASLTSSSRTHSTVASITSSSTDFHLARISVPMTDFFWSDRNGTRHRNIRCRNVKPALRTSLHSPEQTVRRQPARLTPALTGSPRSEPRPEHFLGARGGAAPPSSAACAPTASAIGKDLQ